MRWVRQYKRKESNARPILRRMEKRGRQDEMSRGRPRKEEKEGKTGRKKRQEIPQEQYFVLCNGTIIGSIEQLALSIGLISEEEFRRHVNDDKNDFANWIRDVFHNAELADKMFALKDKKDSQIELLKHVAASR